MKILFGVSPSKIFHVKEFVDELEKLNIECKLVLDTDVSDGFPSRKISHWFQSRKKFEDINRDFKPDAIFVDKQSHFAVSISRIDFDKHIDILLLANYKLPETKKLGAILFLL